VSILWVLLVRYVFQPSSGLSNVTGITILGLFLGLDLVIGYNIWKEWT
jgi:hypothetical protein